MTDYINTRIAETELTDKSAATIYRSNEQEAVEKLISKNKTDVILHAFDWPYADITAKAEEISGLGYRSVLVSPPMKSFKHKEGTEWWQRYQPQDYRVIDNQLGNTQDFAEMISALQRVGVRVYADIVFNHMANESYKRADLQYPADKDIEQYLNDWEGYQSQVLFGDLSKPLFDEEHFVTAFGISDWKDRWEVQNGRITGGPDDPGLPTLKVCKHVVEQQQQYLRSLKQLGVKGFRIDAAKHMSMDHLKMVWTNEITEGMHIFGEIITDGGATKEEYEIFLKPYLEQTRLGAYDFPLFNTVFEAFQKEGSMASLIDPYCFGQALSNHRAITFVITHDIPNNDVFLDLVLDEEDEWLAYSYILGRDGGVPLIYTDLDTSGIKGRDNKPRWMNAWKDQRMMKMIDFHNQVHGETMIPIVSDKDILVFSRGEKGLVAINKSDTPLVVDFEWHREMTDLFSEQYYPVEDGELNLVLDAKSAMMLV
ncbi:alpha-amylase family glycosyl hydrolase [Vibrio hannami]|uniref:alpha-amylase family glycosyl hydrolase n=1 Tax=Vibrio hannami TaxID=2717094 RepID=UPI00240FC47D|nr:alpha-amylase family glycosyl hydrolase [Vibrio hannami]MDG3085408.1 alpha-amylase family glycosyl hydrolase [Vibrio hannami]